MGGGTVKKAEFVIVRVLGDYHIVMALGVLPGFPVAGFFQSEQGDLVAAGVIGVQKRDESS